MGLPTLVGLAALVPLVWSAYRVARTREKRLGRRLALLALVVVGAFSISAAVGAFLVRDTLQVAGDQATAGLDLIRAGDTAGATTQLTLAAEEFATAADRLDSPLLWGGAYVPVVGQHVEALRQVSAAGRDLSTSAATTSSTADYRDLTADNGQVDLARVRLLQGPVADSAAVGG